LAKRRRSEGGGALSLVLGLVVLSVLAVVIGYVLGRFVVFPLMSADRPIQVVTDSESPGGGGSTSDAQPATTEGGPTYSAAEPVRLYPVQVGVFSSKENARNMVASLSSKGFPGYATPDDPYRVFAGVFASESDAARLEASLKDEGYDVYVFELVLNRQSLPTGLPEGYSSFLRESLDGLSTLIVRLAAQWGLWLGGGPGDRDAFVEALGSLEEAASKLNATVQEAGPPEGYADVHRELAELVSLSGKIVDEMNALDSSENGSWAGGMSDFIELVDRCRTLRSSLAE